MAQPNPIATFLLEAEDLLAQIDEIILDLGGQSPRAEEVNQLFRAFHTIKGSGSMFGFDALAAFTHHVETALDQVRAGSLDATPELLDLVLAACEHIRRLLEEAQGGEAAAGESTAKDHGEQIVAKLSVLTGRQETTTVPLQCERAQHEELVESTQHWSIRFRPAADILLTGSNPQAILKELCGLGDCVIHADTTVVPALDQLQPDHCYFAWNIDLESDCGENAIRDVFIFVEDGSEITITPSVDKAAVHEAAQVAQVMEASPASRSSSASPAAEKPLEKIDPVGRPATATETPSAKAVARDTSLRVSSEKLDRLVNLVGELVISQSRLSQSSAQIDAPELAAPVEEIERLVSELRDSILGIRMMPIGATFSRFKRLVYDLSNELGKEIDLVTEGAATELDKTVLDQLSDPLVHLIRNSLDHGIESREAREQAGKPARGTVRLKAVHAGSNVVVSISDDGRGLNVNAIRAKALEKDLIKPDAQLSDKDVYNLILLPGFSTARAITKVSGRGVGMDVVKRQIDGLRGTVAITSVEGQGTEISLTLPLTLAIIEGLLTEVAGEQYIIPMAGVLENVELRHSDGLRNNGRNVVAVRGELISYIPLRETFKIPGSPPEISRIVVVRHEDQRVGLLVDRVIGSHQTVIQSMGKFYRDVKVVSGSTIMGDGRVALILDLAGVIRLANDRPETKPESPTALPPYASPHTNNYAFRG